MNNFSLTLFLEINTTSYIFFVMQSDGQNNNEIVHKLEIPLEGIVNNRISDLEKVSDVIKKNVYITEQKLNYTFKEVVLILENLNPSFINLSGYKKLNGSQILRENITYILNTLKSCVEETEPKKTILHIFNSRFYLDNKKVENLPIGLFGDFYSHELSFILINTNDYKNLKSVFEKVNFKIKKILVKSFIKGVNLSNDYNNIDTFFQIKISEKCTKIFYFENNSLKFGQSFKFGTDIIIKDISKITSLDIDTVRIILDKTKLHNNISKDDLIEENLFKDIVYRKVKKRLIYEIALARIKEISELILFKNTNLQHNKKNSKNIFLEANHSLFFKCFESIYKKTFTNNEEFDVRFINNLSSEILLNTANELVHFGWKKEAIPITQSKKSIIARLFDTIFG